MVSAKCPVCHDLTKEVECMICHTLYHRECWELMGKCSVYACPSQHSSDQIEDFQRIYRSAMGYQKLQAVTGRGQFLVPSLAVWIGMVYMIFLTMCLMWSRPEPRYSTVSMVDDDDSYLGYEEPEIPRILHFGDQYVVFGTRSNYKSVNYTQLDSSEWAIVMSSNPPEHVTDRFFARYSF